MQAPQPLTLRGLLWGNRNNLDDDNRRVQELWTNNVNATREIDEYNGNHVDDTLPKIVIFRPPQQGTEPAWHAGNQLYLKLDTFDEVNQRMNVDFGPFFDFPIEEQLRPHEHAPPDALVPNEPEDISEVLIAGVTGRNMRRRAYVFREVHYLYNMVIVTKAELMDNLSHLKDESRMWEMNQFTLWHSHVRAAENAYLDPIRRILYRKSSEAVQPRMFTQPNRGRSCPECAEYLAWLHQPILLAMALQRSQIPNVDVQGSWKTGIEEALIGEPYVAAVKTKLIERTKASVWNFHRAFRDEWIALVRQKRISEGPDDDEDNDSDDDDWEETRDFPIPNELAYHWSDVRPVGGQKEMKKKTTFTKIFFDDSDDEEVPTETPGMTDDEQRFVRRRRREIIDRNQQRANKRINEGNALQTEAFEGVANLFGNDWASPKDTLASVMKSQLAVGGQIQSFQTFVGTRVHFRLSLVLSGAFPLPPVPADGYVEVEETFFPAMRASPPELPPEPGVLREPLVRYENGKRGIEKNLFEFMRGEQEKTFRVAAYARVMERERRTGYSRLRETLQMSLNPGFGADRFEIVGVEVPLHNPFVLLESSKSRYKFMTTQADFVAVAVDLGTRQTKVVMGEFKTLIETSKPQKRILNNRTFAQSLSNAALFQMQTGVAVDAVMQIFVTRREGTEVNYATCVSMEKLRANQPTKKQLETVTRNITTDIRLQNKKTGIIVYDEGTFAVFRRGFPKNQNGTTVVALPKIKPHTMFHEDLGQAEVDDLVVPPGGPAGGPLERVVEERSWLVGQTKRPLRVRSHREVFVVIPDNQNQPPPQLPQLPQPQQPQQPQHPQQPLQLPPPQQDDGADGGGGGAGGVVFAAGESSFRVAPQVGFGLDRRRYPRNEPPPDKEARLRLRDAVLAAVENIVTTAPVSNRFRNAVDNAGPQTLAAFRWWRRTLNNMQAFADIRPVHGVVNSGNRMTPQLMSSLPTENDYLAKPEAVLRQLVIRALHRFVDDFVLRTRELVNPANPLTVDGFDKVVMSREFIHNSQRAFWKGEVSDWARVQVVPAARNAVVLALS